MATPSKYTRLLVGAPTWASDFSGVTNSLEVELKTDRMESTVFQASGKTFVAGDSEGTISQNGYTQYSPSDDTQNLEARLAAAIDAGTSLTVAALFFTNIDAACAYIARESNAEKMTIAAKTGDLLTLQGQWHQGSGILRGKRVWSGTISATGAQTSPAYLDLGAAGAAGGYAWLFVRDITGAATNAAVQVQSDDNVGFTTPATEGTFTFSSEGVVEVALSGVVDRYVRLNTTGMGGATNFAVTAIVAVSGVTY